MAAEALSEEYQVVHAGLEVGAVAVGVVVICIEQPVVGAVEAVLASGERERLSDRGNDVHVRIGCRYCVGALPLCGIEGLETAESEVSPRALVGVGPYAFKYYLGIRGLLLDGRGEALGVSQDFLGSVLRGHILQRVLTYYIFRVVVGAVLDYGLVVSALGYDPLGERQHVQMFGELLGALHVDAHVGGVALRTADLLQFEGGAVVVGETVSQLEYLHGGALLCRYSRVGHYLAGTVGGAGEVHIGAWSGHQGASAAVYLADRA